VSSPDAKGDDKSNGHEPRLGVTLAQIAAGTFGLTVLVDFA